MALLCSLVLVSSLLLLSSVWSEESYTSTLFDKFGYRISNTTSLLSTANITTIASHILDGTHYDVTKTVLQANSDTGTAECSYLVENDILNITQEDFPDLCPRVLYSLTQDCVKSNKTISAHSDQQDHHEKPSPAAVWGYGFLFVTLINLCSLSGIFVLPLMKKQYYTTVLMFLVALAVGSLSANGLLVLIPEAFEILDMEGYIWRSLCIVGGVYLFFITERILKMLTNRCSKSGDFADITTLTNDNIPSIPVQTYLDVDRLAPTPEVYMKSSGSQQELTSPNDVHLDQVNSNGDMTGQNGTSHESLDKINPTYANSSRNPIPSPNDHTGNASRKPVKTVAWMIIFGDAFHNFIDGLSIGAAFSESTLLGVSICIGVLCEELPHELGDFAILLNAGMSKKRALLFNFLSACTCYFGLIIGISLSEVGHATPWILGLAGGMFLYISLADMMPEMNHAAEEHKDEPVKVFITQNLGVLTGFAVILLVSLYGGEINLAAN